MQNSPIFHSTLFTKLMTGAYLYPIHPQSNLMNPSLDRNRMLLLPFSAKEDIKQTVSLDSDIIPHGEQTALNIYGLFLKCSLTTLVVTYYVSVRLFFPLSLFVSLCRPPTIISNDQIDLGLMTSGIQRYNRTHHQ